MGFGRIFVTSIAIFGTLSLTACRDKSAENREQKSKAAQNERQKALLAEGNGLLKRSEELRLELKALYAIDIIDEPIRKSSGVLLKPEDLGAEYNWGRLTLSERQSAKGQLADLRAATARILAIDAQKGVYMDPTARVIELRHRAIESHLLSLENFERIRGELYNPPTPGQGPVYRGLD